jgi:hypothetical protein
MENVVACKSAQFVFASCAGAAMIFCGQLHGAVVNWVEPGTDIWSEPTNWDTGNIPGNDEAHIDNGGTAVIDDTQFVSTGFAVVAGGTGTTGTLVMTGGSLNTNFDIRIGGNAATGGGTGVFNQSGGSIFMNGGNVNIGFGTTANGTYNLSGGSLVENSNTIFAVGNRGVGTVNMTGGSIYVRGASAPLNSVIQLGRNTAAVGASGTFTLSSGIVGSTNVQFGNAVQTSGVASANEFNLQGTGRLLTDSITIVNTAATNTFKFTGGRLTVAHAGLPLMNNGGILDPATIDFSASAPDLDTLPIAPVGTTTFLPGTSYTQGTNGILAIDLESIASHDFIDIGSGAAVGTATLAGAIAVNLLNAFNPPLGTSFDVLTADSIINNANVTGQTASGGFFASTIVPGSDGRELLRLTVIPEPQSSAVLAGASAMFALIARRRRA